MRNSDTPNFSQIVCGTKAVQEAFAFHRPTRLWWKLILWLHGKPINPSLSSEARLKRLSDGFRFYATLYRLLAVLFFLLSPALILADVTGNRNASLYWGAASLAAALYLWWVSGLGYAGARRYREGKREGTYSLIAFMVMVVAFLSMFLAVLSVVVQHAATVTPVPNLLAASALFLFGVGSYMIEILYLATEHSSQRVERVSEP